MRLFRDGFSYFRRIGVFSLVVCALSSTNSVNAQNLSTPQAILERMIATYAKLSSYQDSGVVRIAPRDSPNIGRSDYSFQNISVQPENLIAFKTYYLKPNRFRFEWMNLQETDGRASVMWSCGKNVCLWMPTQPGSKTFELTSDKDLWFQLDRALSSSLGSVFFVPSLLLKDASGSPFSTKLRLANRVSILREDVVEGELCYVIQAELSGVAWLLWIEKQRFLLLKTKTSYSAGKFDPKNNAPRESFVGEELHSKVKLNQGIPNKVFTYMPALRAQDHDLTLPVRRQPR